MSDAVLNAVSSADFALPSATVAEDGIFLAMLDPEVHAKEALNSRTRIMECAEVAAMIEALQPRCRIAGGANAVRAIFKYQVERQKTLFLKARPIHHAVMHSAPRLTRMLLSAADSHGTLQETLENASEAHTVSPLFLAVLLAEDEVVDTLRRSGAHCNTMDVQAVGRLQTEGLWEGCRQRMEALGLGEEATWLAAKLRERRSSASSMLAALQRAQAAAA